MITSITMGKGMRLAERMGKDMNILSLVGLTPRKT
jgi:hypothetical protein